MRDDPSHKTGSRVRERPRDSKRDPVDRAGESSFPASDPPEWNLSSARPDVAPEQLDAALRALKQQLRALCGQ